MVPSTVYFLNYLTLRNLNTTQSQHNNISRHAMVKLDSMQYAIGGETPSGLGQCEKDIIS